MKPKISHTRSTLAIFWQHSRPYWKHIVVITLGIMLASAADVYSPFLYKELFNIIAGQSTGDPLHILKLIAITATTSWAAWRLTLLTANWFYSKIMANLLKTCFDYLSRHSYNFFNNNFAGSLVRRVNRYPDAYEEMTDQIFFTLFPVLFQLGGIFTVLFINYRTLSTLLLIWAVMYVLANYRFALFKYKFSLERAEADSATTGHLADVIGNSINLKLFNGYKQEAKEFGDLNNKLRHLRWVSWNYDQLAEGTQGLLMVFLEVGVMWFAIDLWKHGNLSVGDLALLQAYLLQVFHQLWGLGRNIHRIYRSLSDAEEMTEILLTPQEILDAPQATKLKVTEATVAFHQVNFGYHDDKPILKNFNLTIAPHQKVALVGPSGGGKSTIVKLIMRFFDIQSGDICIDGQNIANVTQDSLREQIALVPQDPILFHRSLMENIRYARPKATDEEVVKAAKLAHCHEFISKFPEGYATFVGERGVKLSGGERQRVAIARAILKDAPILVLDEATSSLDSESERYIQDALATLMKDKTTIVIAHRLSTIMEMDRILVLENGEITEDGKHGELIKAKQGTYQKLWGIQAGAY